MTCKNSEAKYQKQKSEGHFHFAPKSEKSKFQNFIGGKFQRQLFKWPPKTNGKAQRPNFCFKMTVTDNQELSESFGAQNYAEITRN